MQDGRSLVRNGTVIAGIRPRQGGLDQVETADPIQSAVGKSLIMSSERIRERQPVVPSTDLRDASARNGAWTKPP